MNHVGGAAVENQVTDRKPVVLSRVELSVASVVAGYVDVAGAAALEVGRRRGGRSRRTLESRWNDFVESDNAGPEFPTFFAVRDPLDVIRRRRNNRRRLCGGGGGGGGPLVKPQSGQETVVVVGGRLGTGAANGANITIPPTT